VSRERPARARRWLAPEVVQVSTMDCGPAALKCLLEGFHIPVSYGRLREACQTDVDGTSIDTVETVARRLGLDAEQVLIPADHVALDSGRPLPALAVVRQADTAPHFVVVWRRWRDWLQVMDPALGRRWVRLEAFRQELYRHEAAVNAADWRAWAGSPEFLSPLAGRLTGLGVEAAGARALVAEALADEGWFPIGALDAATRLAQSLAAAGGVRRGADAAGLVAALFRQTCARGDDIYALVPRPYWSAVPDASNTDPTVERLRVAGAVLVHVSGPRTAEPAQAEEPPLSPELAAALSERPATPIGYVWRLLQEDGLVGPLIAAMGVASAAMVLETLLFRGLFDMAGRLGLSSQRLWAALALMAFVLILLFIELPIALETLRHGRQLEARLRMALLRKLPRLNDRYFQSRPITDMADRNHNIYAIRNVPGMGLELVQSLAELLLTLLGVALIAPDTAGPALLLVATAIAIPLAVQPLLNERDLRVRNHAGALHGFYLDALLGLAPVRAHRAERSVRRQHEGLLVEWAQSLRGWMLTALVNESVQATVCTALAGGALALHFVQVGRVSGSDLLLVYWVLKLPAAGGRLAGLAHRYPAQRNVLLRLLEPLSAPEDLDAAQPTATRPAASSTRGAGISINGGRILAGGHEILRDLELKVRPGEHVAIVGPSGAGKSSLLGLLLGWHRLAAGEVLVDGARLGVAEVEQLRRVTAWVDPAIQIWNRSLLENLEYAAEDGELDRIGDVIAAARLRGVAESLPQGLQSLLGEGGGRLSGGEGQRVRLGRALFASGTRLALLDEPFRGMDREQRRTLLAEARAWWQEVTLLCVTHDVGETQGFDRVLVVEGGRIVEDGSPAALAAGPTRYRDLLEAESRVQKTLWRGSQWRRLSMVEGRLKATGSRR
jgi:ATP-binding cassette subfamily B protein